MTEEQEPKLKEDERYCFKCKTIVHKKEFHGYYEICCDCVTKSRSH